MNRAVSIENLMRAEIECGVCYDDEHPLCLIPCQHKFCHQCIDRIIAESLENTDDPVFTCPECRQEYSVPANGFPVFRLLERFREQLDTAEPQQEEETYSQSDSDSMSSYASIGAVDANDIELQVLPDQYQVHCQQVDPEEYIIAADPDIPQVRAPPVPNCRPNSQPDKKDNEMARQVMLGIREYECMRKRQKRKEINCKTGFWSTVVVVIVLVICIAVFLFKEIKWVSLNGESVNTTAINGTFGNESLVLGAVNQDNETMFAS